MFKFPSIEKPGDGNPDPTRHEQIAQALAVLREEKEELEVELHNIEEERKAAPRGPIISGAFNLLRQAAQEFNLTSSERRAKWIRGRLAQIAELMGQYAIEDQGVD